MVNGCNDSDDPCKCSRNLYCDSNECEWMQCFGNENINRKCKPICIDHRHQYHLLRLDFNIRCRLRLQLLCMVNGSNDSDDPCECSRNLYSDRNECKWMQCIGNE